VFETHTLKLKKTLILDERAKDPFYVIFKYSRKLISRSNRWMMFLTNFTKIHLFFKSILIRDPSQGSVKLFTMRVEYEKRTPLRYNYECQETEHAQL